MRAFIRRHAAASYFVLTFAISWGGLIAIVGVRHLIGTPDEFERLFPRVLPIMVLGPSLSGVVLTAVIGGKAGLSDFAARLVRWRVGSRWYAVALLTAPVYFTLTMLAMSAFSREYLPGVVTTEHRASYILFGLVVALVAGIVEEIGWTGLAVPALRRRHGAFGTGLIVGVLWGAWHALPKIWGAAAHGIEGYMLADVVGAIVGLAGFRILMVWVYDRTNQSLLIAILMHLGLTASTLILQPTITGLPLLTMGMVLTLVPWLIVASVVLVQTDEPSNWLRRRVPPRTPVSSERSR